MNTMIKNEDSPREIREITSFPFEFELVFMGISPPANFSFDNFSTALYLWLSNPTKIRYGVTVYDVDDVLKRIIINTLAWTKPQGSTVGENISYFCRTLASFLTAKNKISEN